MVPEQCGQESASQSVVQKGGGSVVLQKGDGEARENDFREFRRVNDASLSVRGNFPKSATSLTRDSGYISPTLLPQPVVQQLFSTQCKSNGFYFLSPSP
jgi:hypothetical protein